VTYLRFKDFVFNHEHGRVNFKPVLPKNDRAFPHGFHAPTMPSPFPSCKKNLSKKVMRPSGGGWKGSVGALPKPASRVTVWVWFGLMVLK
jgi:hypothetical protein